MSEEVPLKASDSEEFVIGRSSNASLTIKTIRSTVKKYWFKKGGKKTDKKANNGFGINKKISPRNKLILSVYKDEFVIKIKNYMNISRLLPFILIFITLFRFIYLNALLITYFRSMYTHSTSCLVSLIIVYLIFLFRSVIDSLETQIIPIFTLISVYYKFVSFKSHHVLFISFWPLFGMILSYILYGILFCFVWNIICSDESIKWIPLIFWEWFIGFKYIIHIFNGKWNILYLFNLKYWNSFDVIYCNYFIMSYLPYLFIIGLVFAFLLLRHIFLNIKSILKNIIYKTWSNFKQFYIILIPIILLRFIYLMSMWIVFFFYDKTSLYHSSSSTSCDLILFTLFFIMIFHSVADAIFSPLIAIELFMYFKCIHRILNQILNTICNKYIIFENDYDYKAILSDKKSNKLIKCFGKKRLIIISSICLCFIKLILFYFVFGVIFVFMSFGIIWANCDDSNIRKSPLIIWKWFTAPKYLLNLFNHNEWNFEFIININKWSSIQNIFLNYVIICFVPYLIMIGIIILFKIGFKLYHFLIILTEGFSRICGAEFTLFFVVFVFYRWLYLVFMWYELIFNDDNENLYNKTDNIWCKISLLCVFTVIIFRSIFDSFLCIEFFVFTFDRDLWSLFIIALFWSLIKLVISYVIFAILSIFFLFGFSFIHCVDSNVYLMLFWEWFIAPKYLLHLINDYGIKWEFKYLFHRKYWRSIDILYINYTLTAYCPMILIMFCVCIYYLCHYKSIRHNHIFTLFCKRIQLIITILLSYNHLLCFIIYCYHYKINIFIAISVQIICYLLFIAFHSYFTLSLSYYKSIAKYWFLKAIDWNETFLLFGSVIHDYGEHSVLWNESWNELKKRKRNKESKHLVYYYWYFRFIHILIKLIFLSLSIILYCIEVLFKLILLTLYLILRFIHHFVMLFLMYFAKFAQIQCIIHHYSRYCVGIKHNNNDDGTTSSNNDSKHSSLSSIKLQETLNIYWLFNLSIFIDATFGSFSLLIIVIVNNLMMKHWNIHILLDITTIWTLFASLLLIINALFHIIPQFKNKGNLKDALSNHMFGADKTHSIQYALITSDTDGKCVVLGDVVQY